MTAWAPGRIICSHILVALLLSSVALILATDEGALAQTASAINCNEFIDQAEAQRFFEVKGGPSFDPYFLDVDHDGLA